MFVAFFVLEERKIKTIKLIKKNHLISVNEVSEAIQLKWKEPNNCFTQPLILKRVYGVVRDLIRKYLNVRKRGKGKDSASCVKDDCVKGLHVTNCKCEKEQKIPELLLRFKLQDILNSTYSTISIVAQMAAAEKFNKVYDLPPIIEEDEDVDFIGVGEKNIEVVMSHANVDRGKAVTALKNKVNNDIIKCYYGTCYVNFTDD